MTPIFFSPAPSRMTSNSDCSSAASAGAPPAAGPAAATATGAAAVTSKVSSNALTNSDSSSSVSSLNASSRSSVDSLAMIGPSLLIYVWVGGGLFGGVVRRRRALGCGLGRCLGCWLRSLRNCGCLGGHLLLQCREQPGCLRLLRSEQAGGLGQVGLHRAGQLGQQHLARLQVGDLLDLGDGQRATVHVAALDDQRFVVLGELLQRLGGVDSLAPDERDRGRTDEQFVEPVDARLRRGPLDQRALGDRIGGGVTERSAQILEVGDGQSAVLGDQGGRRILELLGDVGNRGGLFSLGHACLLVVGIGLPRLSPEVAGNDERPDA